MFWKEVLASAVASVLILVAAKLVAILRKRQLNWRQASVWFATGVVLVSATDFTPIRVGETFRVAFFGPPSLNERWTLDAWHAFDKNDFMAAIASAQKVVKEYGPIALKQQRDQDTHGVSAPPIGRAGPFTSSRIFDNGLVNDVATCYWIQGRSYEAVGREPESRAAYERAAMLTRGRTLDPQWWPFRGWSPVGWFWSPADSAQARLTSNS